MRRERRFDIKTAFVLLSSLFVAFLLWEFGGQLLFSREVTVLQDPDHRMKPNQRPSGEDPNSLTNSQGIRSVVEPSQVVESSVNIILLGDSFAFGYRVPPEKALPQRLEALARAHFGDRQIHVFNFGWTSSSPLLSLRLLRDMGSDYKPDTVILLLDISSDFHDDLKYHHWLESSIIDVIPFTYGAFRKVSRRVAPTVSEWLYGWPADRFFIVNRPLAETREYLDLTVSIIDEIAEFTEKTLHAEFILAAFPRGFMFSDRESPNNWEAYAYTPLGPYVLEPFKYMDEIASSGGIKYPYLSLLPPFMESGVFPTSFEDDPHWNDAGTELAASAIFSSCLKLGCFENR